MRCVNPRRDLVAPRQVAGFTPGGEDGDDGGKAPSISTPGVTGPLPEVGHRARRRGDQFRDPMVRPLTSWWECGSHSVRVGIGGGPAPSAPLR